MGTARETALNVLVAQNAGSIAIPPRHMMVIFHSNISIGLKLVNEVTYSSFCGLVSGQIKKNKTKQQKTNTITYNLKMELEF